MRVKAYVLLDIVDGNCDQVAQMLRSKRGVLMVDSLEGPPDLIMVVEASDKQKLAQLAVDALASVETVTQGLQILPTRDRLNTHAIG